MYRVGRKLLRYSGWHRHWYRPAMQGVESQALVLVFSKEDLLNNICGIPLHSIGLVNCWYPSTQYWLGYSAAQYYWLWYSAAPYWLGYSAAWHRHWYRPATTEWLWHRPGGDQLCPSILINQLSGCYHLPPFIFIWFFNYQILPFIFIIFNNYMTFII